MDVQFTVSDERFVDAGEQDMQGFCDYYYSGLILRVTANDVTYKIVCYDNMPETATVKEVLKAGNSTLIVDPIDPMFRAIVEHLASKYRIERIRLYEPELGYFQTFEITKLFA